MRSTDLVIYASLSYIGEIENQNYHLKWVAFTSAVGNCQYEAQVEKWLAQDIGLSIKILS